ncbi:MAG: hypothetical protein RJA70_805 [Pseudomonadota bacterium]|jgi:hypothetical protein
MKTSLRNSGVVSAVAVLLVVAVGAVSSCQKEGTPPPLPTAKTAEPAKVEELKVPDAGTKKVEDEEDKPSGKGGFGKPKGALAGCCAALRQNAPNAPDPTKGHMLTAAAACEVANNAGAAKAGFLATLAGLLRGAGVPPACQ